MNQFLSEIYEKYTKIVKSANWIGFLNWLAKINNIELIEPISQPLTKTQIDQFENVISLLN